MSEPLCVELDSGVRVVTHAMANVETVSIGAWFSTGNRDEHPDEHGLAHFLEHMVFKGTARRSARDIAEQIESVGGELNACTGNESTAYFTKVLPEHAALSVDVLSDMLLNSRFDREEIAREKDVVIQEIGMAEDSPDDVASDALQRVVFGGGPMARSILGTRDTIRRFGAADLRRFIQCTYTASRCVIAAAGALSHERIVEWVRDAFSALPRTDASEANPARFHAGEARIEQDHEQVYAALAFPSFSIQDPRRYAVQVLSVLLGGGASSRLYQEIRERRGLCYSIGTFYSPYRETGVFGVHASTGPETLSTLLHTTVGELKRVTETVEPGELDRARAQCRMGLLGALESTGLRADQIARQIHAFGRVISAREAIERLDAVSCDTVQEIAGGMFADPKFALAAVGPIRTLPAYDAIQNQF